MEFNSAFKELTLERDKLFSYSTVRDTSTNTALSQGSQTSPACSSDQSSFNVKMNKEQWCNGSDRGE